MDKLMSEDALSVINDKNIPINELSGKTVLITGSTGLIGRNLVNTLLYYSKTAPKSLNIILPVRNVKKAESLFKSGLSNLNIQKWEAEDEIDVHTQVDYIVHCAANTSSKGFVQQPVETIRTAYLGTENVLKFAAAKKVKSIVYLSTMEVYGTPFDDRKITESYSEGIDTMNVRNSYPESKRLCETLCAGYAKEYDVPVSVIRLTQCLGPGIEYNDGRVVAQFARCAVENKDIILRTKGETKRSYLYTTDAVRAILLVLLKGEKSGVYNAANEETYCSIYEMAMLVAEKAAGGKIDVKIEEAEDMTKLGYAPTLHMNLDTSKLKSLGFTAQVNLSEAFNRLIAYIKEEKTGEKT